MDYQVGRHRRYSVPWAASGSTATAAALVAVVLACSGCWNTDRQRGSLTAAEITQRRNLAAGLMGQFKYAEAVQTLRPLVEADAANGDLRVDLAIALLNRRAGDDLAESAALLEAVSAASPENPRALYCRALLWFHEGQTDQALDAFTRVVQQDPDDAYAAYYAGQCWLGRKAYARAVEWFQRAGEIDPYLRSACYGESQALQRLGKRDEARAALAEFQRLATNPRSRVAELKYTRMGPKAEVQAGPQAAPAPPPAGPMFAGMETVRLEGSVGALGAGANTTVVDLSGDGELDLFVADPDGGTHVLLGNGDGFRAESHHALAGKDKVVTALWGDYDNDGLVDVYLCRRGPNQLWRQSGSGKWDDVTDAAGVGAGDFNTVDGACYDVDHDGDLDYLLVQEDAPCELLSNNRDGTFRSLASELGLAADADGAAGLVVADLDRDDDADLVLLNQGRPHRVLRNDRLWNYAAAPGFDALAAAKITACVAADVNVDGQVELFTSGPRGVERWSPGADGVWSATLLSETPTSALAVYDFDGDAAVELLVISPTERRVIDPVTGQVEFTLPGGQLLNGLAVVVGAQGPEILGCSNDGALSRWPAGPGRYAFARVALGGKTDRALEMRSNASGIGVTGAARVGHRWATLPGQRPASTAGQSLQPLAIGAAGAEQLDFLRLLWPDGVSQTELQLTAGELHRISETQRQAGSCPLLFVWDGERFAFVADLLGAGGIGFNLGRGEYYPPRPEESLLLPAGVLRPRNGSLIVKLGEPMEEICYFDAVRLVAYDLPPGWSMTLDERFAGLGPGPTGAPVYYRQALAAVSAVNDRGEDVTHAVADADGQPAPLARRDHRFIGLSEPHSVTLKFAQPLDELRNPVLMFDGWVDYAYSQSAFAAWQAGETFVEPTVEAQGADGAWTVVADRFGYPAGTARQGSIALSKAEMPRGARRLRVSSNMLVYWDRLAVVDARPCPDARRVEMAFQHARVSDVGFSARRLFPHRRSVYDYDDRPPLADTRHPAGYYTEFGDATELVAQTDDAVAIIGPGEELHAEFAAPSRNPPAGWTRRWVLEADGWCKDADLFTENAGAVEPLPRRDGDADPARREELHKQYNTRFRSGY